MAYEEKVVYKSLSLFSVLMVTACGSSSSSLPDESSDLLPASEVEAQRMGSFEFDTEFEFGDLSVLIKTPRMENGDSRYGADTWIVDVRVENPSNEDLSAPQINVRCSDGEEGEWWVDSTYDMNSPLPARSFVDGIALVSSPITEYSDPPVLHNCEEPRLIVQAFNTDEKLLSPLLLG